MEVKTIKRVIIFDKIAGQLFDGDNSNLTMSMLYKNLKEEYGLTSKEAKKKLEWYDKPEDLERIENIYFKGGK